MALEAAILRRYGEKIFVLLDNQAAVSALHTGQSTSYRWKAQIFDEICERERPEVRWVPGHSNIGGNEETDVAARNALHLLPNRNIQPDCITLAYQRRLMHQRRQELVNGRWSRVYPAQYRDLDLQTRRQKPPELGLPRKLLQVILAARSGHGDFAVYHRRINHENANTECDCGQETAPTNFVRFWKNITAVCKRRRSMLMGMYTSQLLGPKCLKMILEFEKETGCFGSLPSHLSLSERGTEENRVLENKSAGAKHSMMNTSFAPNSLP